MKVLHFSAADYRTGAGIACIRLHKALLAEGIDSRVFFLTEDRVDEVGIIFYGVGLYRKLKRLFSTFTDRLLVLMYSKRPGELFSPGLMGLDVLRVPEVLSADILHLHWVNHGFIDVKDLLSLGKPIIWTMHDCWTFTGGCHHFFKCEGYTKNCGQCPVLNSSKRVDLSSFMMERKLRYVSQRGIKFIAISNWMKKSAENSSILKFESVEVIPSAIDISVFKLLDYSEFILKKEDLLGDNDAILLVGAQDINSPYKGMTYLVEALNEFSIKKLTVLTFGSGRLKIDNPIHKVVNLGFISDMKEMNRLYNIADVFLSTSVAESFGMTVAEAQCAGTPVIVFGDTGSSDILDHLSTGYVSEFENVGDVVNGLNFCLNFNFDRENISMQAQSKFSIELSARRYVELYKLEFNREL